MNLPSHLGGGTVLAVDLLGAWQVRVFVELGSMFEEALAELARSPLKVERRAAIAEAERRRTLRR